MSLAVSGEHDIGLVKIKGAPLGMHGEMIFKVVPRGSHIGYRRIPAADKSLDGGGCSRKFSIRQ